eukprot:CAMPEP_0204594782 /NCGR_PEP_ID=MMETSP0661-20131031/52280_1 /ASSEMBLY_ACC=CAM_ASM_000606 /TAXON_ID=109239 /ORGANISM="Alexandrium margalefi, Strain AMGDE01CS-322" /LENGTH=270 /DNA_ID=CAMNT_0051605219 /DNA_START=82 /DNA_END=894 /DNA_ORIENTATION=+
MVAAAAFMRLLCIAAFSAQGWAATPQALLQKLWASRDLSASGEEAKPTAVPTPRTFKLRLCNAYAWSAPLEMRRVQEPKLVEYPLPYKECHDYTLPLSDGDELQFRAGDLNIGNFYVRGLPKNPTMLLLVPHRKDRQSMAVVFDSHMYAQGENPQVALVDAFTGDRTGSGLYLKEKEHREALHFSSVVTLTPGKYEVGLDRNSTKAASANLQALHQEKYVVIRVGNGVNATNEAWPEEMMVFPKSSGAASKALGSLLAVLAWCALTALHL